MGPGGCRSLRSWSAPSPPCSRAFLASVLEGPGFSEPAAHLAGLALCPAAPPPGAALVVTGLASRLLAEPHPFTPAPPARSWAAPSSSSGRLIYVCRPLCVCRRGQLHTVIPRAHSRSVLGGPQPPVAGCRVQEGGDTAVLLTGFWAGGVPGTAGECRGGSVRRSLRGGEASVQGACGCPH